MDYDTVTVDGQSEVTSSADAGAFSSGDGSTSNTWGGYSFGSVSAYTSASATIPISFMTSTTSGAESGMSEASSGFSSVASAGFTSATDGEASVTSSAVPSSTSTTSTGGSTSGKKGLAYNEASLTNAFDGAGISWVYNWADTESGTALSGAEYVPMLWGAGNVDGWASAAQAAISAGSSHVLSFNEPDLSKQSNISPSDAAALHKANMGNFGPGVRVGSPAVTNGGGSNPPMGTTWLQEFFDACDGGCKVDFVACHWYSNPGMQYFQDSINAVIATAQANGVNTVWLTEFGASGDDADVAPFITSAMEWLDQQPAVERYAYYMCADGTLLSGSSLSSLGQAYAA